MGMRDEIGAICEQADQARQIAEEIEQEGADFWAQASMRLEQQRWEADQAAIAEYESWFIQKTSE